MEIIEPIRNSFYQDRPVMYATFWKRFAAHNIDLLIVNVPMYYFDRVVLHDNLYFAFYWGIVVSWLYRALQESGHDMATIGQRALQIKVTDLHCKQITFARATGRHFGKWISSIILFIGYFEMLWDDKSQTLHDKMAGTLVISA